MLTIKTRKDKEVVLAAVRKNGWTLECASDELRGNKEVALAAVKKDGYALKCASDELRADKEVALAAVAQNGYALQFVAQALQTDKEIALAAVKKHGGALQYASEDLRADRDFILAAVAQNGWALQNASPELQADKEVVFAAVVQDGGAIECAKKELLEKFPNFGEFLEKVQTKEYSTVKILPPKGSQYLVFKDQNTTSPNCILLKYPDEITNGNKNSAKQGTEDVKILNKDTIINKIFEYFSLQDILLFKKTQRDFNDKFEKGYYFSKFLGFEFTTHGIKDKEVKFDLDLGKDKDNICILLQEKPQLAEDISVDSVGEIYEVMDSIS